MWSLVLLTIGAFSQQTCPMYNCHEGGFDVSPTCAQVTPQGNVLLQVCDNSTLSYCDVSGTITTGYTCTSGPSFTKPLAYPGEYCMENSNCITNICLANTCVGQNPGGACTSNSDCGVGLYCGTSFWCTPQLLQYQTCTSDYQCSNNLACNRTIFEDGVCIPYFSIPNGALVGMCVDMLVESVSNLCQSGACTLTNPGFDSIGICSPAFHTATALFPIICESDLDCVGYNGVNFTEGACSCGMDQYGRGYCDSYAGDPPGATVQLLWELHVNSTGINNCHTQRRFDPFCLQQNLGPSQVQNFMKNRAEATDTARFQGNDFCTQSIFNHQYFNLSPANLACQAYSCANLEGWEAGTCVTFTEATNSFAVSPCTESSMYPYCDYTKAENNKWRNITCGPNPGTEIRYAGEPCETALQCLSGTCTSGKCIGTAQNAPCTSSDQCNIGYFCASVNFMFTCQPLIAAFEYGCGSDFDCVNSCGCNFNSNGPPGMCIPYYNLTIGQSVTCSSAGVSNLCQTGACYNPGSSIIGVCTVAPTTVGTLPLPCTFNGQCTGSNSLGQTFTGTCTCGYNPTGTQYCTPFIGDPMGVSYLNATKQFFAKNGPIGQCQTTRRFSKDCYDVVSRSMGINPNIWYSQYYNYTYYPYLIGNDECVQTVYTSAFWTSQPPGPHPEPVPTPYGPNPDAPIIYYGHGLFLAAVSSIAFIL